MCVAAMSAKAQVLTSKTVNNVYETVSHQANGNYIFNAEWTGKDIKTMYVFEKSSDSRGLVGLTPHLKYEYTYAADGALARRVVYHWNGSQDNWACTARYDYTLANGKYCVEYSRYNNTAQNFDLPVEKMVYSLMPDDSADYVCSYHRDRPTSPYQLVSETFIPNGSLLFAEK